jgi:YesN/AraC family two-component response regulator
MSGSAAPTALIADDEPLLRERLRSHLERLWPALRIVGEARNGREAIELFDERQPQIVFLDVHMPGMNGIDAARRSRIRHGLRTVRGAGVRARCAGLSRQTVQ